jgi:predicted PurR-regulated permease PerM
VVLYILSLLQRVLVPFGLSLAVAYVANPLINYFEVKGLRRQVTVMAVYLMIAGAVSSLANRTIQLVARDLALLQTQAPAYIKSGQALVISLQDWLARKVPFASQVIAQWDTSMYTPIIEQTKNIPGYLLGIFPLLSFVFLIPFISFFLLTDGRRTVDFLIQACPSRYVEGALHLISEIETSLGNYLRGILIAAMAISLASFAGLWALGVNYALGISLLSGLSSFVPYMGAIMGAVLGGLAATFQFHALGAGLQVVLLFLVIRLADEAFLEPIIARYSVRLHPLLFLLALLAGGELFGFMGLVFAVPAACVLKALIQVTWSWYSTETRLAVPATVPSAAVPYT